MNIIEAEDMVKGLPDQVLFQYAQNPPPNIPQFLAISEVQRRQDMRQRFQAQQAGQQQPTVKDQILQQGIAATGMAPQVSSAPPMAPSMPQGVPPAMGQQAPVMAAVGGMMPRKMYNGGLTPGGIVYMQEGRTVPGATLAQRVNQLRDQIQNAVLSGASPNQIDALRSELRSLTDSAQLSPSAQEYQTFQRIREAGIYPEMISPRVEPEAPNFQIDVPQEARGPRAFQGARDLAEFLRRDVQKTRPYLGKASPETQPAVAASAPAAPAAAPAAAPGPVDFMAAQRQPQTNFNMPPPAPIAAPQAAPQVAPPAPPAPNVAPGGIGDLAPRQPTGGIPSYLANLLKPQERSPEVQAAIDLNRQMAEQGLPAPVDLSQYVKSAQQRQQEARDEARRMAIANTLMGLGTGLVAGDPAAGLQRATQMATETLREGRKEAQAEGRMAEQLQLQQAQQQRQAALDAMKFKSESVNAIASLVSGEEKANRNDRLQAAQIVATYNAALERNRAELAAQGRVDERSERTARTAALQSAREAYLTNTTNTMGKTNQQIAQEINEMARLLDPEAFGSSGSTTATPSGKSRFTITEVRTGR